MNETARNALRQAVLDKRAELHIAIEDVEAAQRELRDARAVYDSIKQQIIDLLAAAGDPLDVDPARERPVWDVSVEAGAEKRIRLGAYLWYFRDDGYRFWIRPAESNPLADREAHVAIEYKQFDYPRGLPELITSSLPAE